MDISVNTYRHRHHHITVPHVDLGMHEKDTGSDWVIRSSVDLAYVIRYGELSKYDHGGEMFEADLMKRRLECSFLVGNQQFVEFEREGHILITELPSTPFGVAFGLAEVEDSKAGTEVARWFGAFTQHVWLSRAAEDIHTALKLPAEDVLFVFRAFEWLQKGLDVSWANLGERIDVPQHNLTSLKKRANNWDTAVRHAVTSGRKTRFGDDRSWVHGALHAIVHSFAYVDPEYKEWLDLNEDSFPI